ncbi:hypothetical protein VTK26DRAFT_7648 [Humicola hyalothermophila]
MTIWDRSVGQQITSHAQRESAENRVNFQRQYLWNTPDGNRPDFSETYTHGEDIFISWNALNNSMYDLWLTSWIASGQYDPDPVALCLARAVNLAHDGNLKLVTPDPPSAQFANRTRYVLRFKPPTGDGRFSPSDPDLSSPGFFIVNRSENTKDVSSTTTPATATASAASRELPSSSSAPDETVENMTPLTAAGLTIGLVIGVVCLVILEVMYFTWRRKRQRGQAGEEEKGPMLQPSRSFGDGDRGQFIPAGKVEMSSRSPWMSPELPGTCHWGQAQIVELHGGARRAGAARIVNGSDPDIEPPRRAATLNSSLVELDSGRG